MNDLQRTTVGTAGLLCLLTVITAPLEIIYVPGKLNTQDAAAPQVSHRVSWSNVDSVYNDLKTVQPFLVNNSDKTIYFRRGWQFATASVLRMNDINGQWEIGAETDCCGTLENPDEPLSLRPNERMRIGLEQSYISTADGLRMFMLQDSLTLRPAEGRYRLRMFYALEPWTVIHTPSATFATDSPDFVVVKSKLP